MKIVAKEGKQKGSKFNGAQENLQTRDYIFYSDGKFT